MAGNLCDAPRWDAFWRGGSPISRTGPSEVSVRMLAYVAAGFSERPRATPHASSITAVRGTGEPQPRWVRGSAPASSAVTRWVPSAAALTALARTGFGVAGPGHGAHHNLRICVDPYWKRCIAKPDADHQRSAGRQVISSAAVAARKRPGRHYSGRPALKCDLSTVSMTAESELESIVTNVEHDRGACISTIRNPCAPAFASDFHARSAGAPRARRGAPGGPRNGS